MNTEKKIPLQYYIKEAFYSLKTSRGRSFISIATIGFSLFIVGVYFLLSLNIQIHIQKWQEEIQVEVFLNDDLSLKETEKLGAKLRENEAFEKVTYLSKKEAWNKFKEQGYEPFLTGLTKNPLPASFQIMLTPPNRKPSEIKKISASLLKIPGIEDISTGLDLIQKLEIIGHFFRFTGFFIGMLIFFASVFIISNTIKLSLYTRINEINIMKLVGGTNKFIMMPYIFEGIIQGVLGAIFAISLLSIVYELFLSRLRFDEMILLGFGNIEFISFFQGFMMLIFGVSIGVIGSYISVGQFLKSSVYR